MDTLKENEYLRRKIELLNQVGQAFSSVDNPDELLHLVLRKSMDLTDSDAGSIYLVEKKQDRSVLVFKTALNNSIDTNFVGEHIDINKETGSGFVASTGSTVVINDIETEQEFSIISDIRDIDYRIHNMMIVPMKNFNKEIVGVVQLLNKKDSSNQKQDFTVDDKELLLSISSQLAVTVDRLQTNELLARNVSLTRTTLISFFNGMKQAMSTIGEDILEEQDKFKQYATYDPLTGLLTRKEGLAFLEKQLEFARFNGVKVVVCFIDVNNLKYVNDTFGHAEGDYLLKTVSSTIKNTARENDTIFRYGGDEFILVLYNINKQTAKHVWNRIQSNLNRIAAEDNKPYELSAAVGFSEYNHIEKQSIKELIELADSEMYIHKQEYKKQKSK